MSSYYYDKLTTAEKADAVAEAAEYSQLQKSRNATYDLQTRVEEVARKKWEAKEASKQGIQISGVQISGSAFAGSAFAMGDGAATVSVSSPPPPVVAVASKNTSKKRQEPPQLIADNDSNRFKRSKKNVRPIRDIVQKVRGRPIDQSDLLLEDGGVVGITADRNRRCVKFAPGVKDVVQTGEPVTKWIESLHSTNDLDRAKDIGDIALEENERLRQENLLLRMDNHKSEKEVHYLRGKNQRLRSERDAARSGWDRAQCDANKFLAECDRLRRERRSSGSRR